MSSVPPYPGGNYPSSSSEHLQPPRSVIHAVYLMYVGAVWGVVGIILTFAAKSSIRTAVRKANKNATAHTINNDVNAILVIAVIGGIIGIGLWLWMAWKNKQGRAWARILGTVFFGLGTISFLANLFQHTAALAKVAGGVTWVVGLLAVILLWRPESSAYFRSASGPMQDTPFPNQPPYPGSSPYPGQPPYPGSSPYPGQEPPYRGQQPPYSG